MGFGTHTKNLIRLSSYVVGSETDILHGEPRLSSDGRFNIGITNVKLPLGLVAPKNCLVALYGFRDAADEMRRQSEFWRNTPGAIFQSVQMDFEVGTIESEVIPLKAVPATFNPDGTEKKARISPMKEQRFANFMRTKEEVQTIVADIFKGHADPDSDVKFKKKDIALRPDLWSYVLENEHFKNLEILIIPVAVPRQHQTGAERQFDIRQFALITKEAKLFGKLIQNPKSKIQATLGFPLLP